MKLTLAFFESVEFCVLASRILAVLLAVEGFIAAGVFSEFAFAKSHEYDYLKTTNLWLFWCSVLSGASAILVFKKPVIGLWLNVAVWTIFVIGARFLFAEELGKQGTAASFVLAVWIAAVSILSALFWHSRRSTIQAVSDRQSSDAPLP